MNDQNTTMTAGAAAAYQTILKIRRHPSSQSGQAEKKVLSRLSVSEYMQVVDALEG